MKINIITKFDKEKTVLSSFTIEIPGDRKIKNLIEISRDKFNEYFHEKGMKLMLVNKPKNNFELRPSKKNGQPKLDLPSIDGESYVCDTQIHQFSFIYCDEDLIQLREMKKTRCERCLIMWRIFFYCWLYSRKNNLCKY